MSNFWRSALATRTMLIAALTVSVGLGSYNWGTTSDTIRPSNSSSSSNTKQVNPATFTTADTGSCLTWESTDGVISNFEQTDCAGEHRFEISSREDLSAYPSSEFGSDASMPNLTRQAQLREELCYNSTISYLGGTFDPLGRYSVASILPPETEWAAGDRTLLCGVQATDDNGTVIMTTGNAANQDQARTFAAGQCLFVDAASATHIVDCAQDHHLEITSVVDLQPAFPDRIPNIEEQDAHLQSVCTQAALDYLGSDDALYYSTLQPFWTTLNSNSWSGGSHSVNCALTKATPEKGFAVLSGSAKTGFTINGQAPESLPERAPIVNPEALASLAPAAENG
ncbi:septum formation family protein [Corynebacterium kutscheri]|uniref:Secreted protein n=1 Tax=Corynebacterium kutscheri TaxID=35755 RepID=A0A0F6R169_9CORY|nr:septum formation family protein [Corynebacterium kutscheri]AKE42147.1 Septum formation [Corynebacterium kutscheri]VEH05885.1 putative secreted protein [Corynebacterium kutscheri]VEH10490.1 putative secreted protein [Corynebacterium kutscheri]